MGKKKKRGGTNRKGSLESELVAGLVENGSDAVIKDSPEETKTETEPELKYTVADLMDRVEQYLENFEYDMALTFCKKAIALEPDNTKVLEGSGNVCAEIGDIDNARIYFQKAVEIEPKKGHVKYLYLGQLSEGSEAVKYYEAAIPLMKNEIEYQKNNIQDDSAEKNKLTDKAVSNVYCSLAEIYMTDLCMEENAESMCEKYCKSAMEADKTNLEAAVSMCNLLLSQDNMDSAVTVAEKAYNLWSSISKDVEEELLPEAMSYEARVTLIKLLIEVEGYDKVSKIVDQLIEENEDDIRIWYYLGLVKFLMKDKDDPRFYLEKAVELYEKTGCEDKDMLAHLNELLESCPKEEDDESMDAIEEENDGEKGEEADGVENNSKTKNGDINDSMDVEE